MTDMMHVCTLKYIMWTAEPNRELLWWKLGLNTSEVRYRRSVDFHHIVNTKLNGEKPWDKKKANLRVLMANI